MILTFTMLPWGLPSYLATISLGDAPLWSIPLLQAVIYADLYTTIIG